MQFRNFLFLLLEIIIRTYEFILNLLFFFTSGKIKQIQL